MHISVFQHLRGAISISEIRNPAMSVQGLSVFGARCAVFSFCSVFGGRHCTRVASKPENGPIYHDTLSESMEGLHCGQMILAASGGMVQVLAHLNSSAGNEQCSLFGNHVFGLVILFGVWLLCVLGLCSGVVGVGCSGSVWHCTRSFGVWAVFGSSMMSVQGLSGLRISPNRQGYI